MAAEVSVAVLEEEVLAAADLVVASVEAASEAAVLLADGKNLFT